VLAHSPTAQVHDVTLTLSDDTPSWPTHPPVSVAPLRRMANGDGNNVSRLALSAHAGTHVDAPWHFVDDGPRLDQIPLDRWVGPCLVVRIPDDVPLIGPDHLEAAAIPPGTERLLLRTANSNRWAAGDLAFREDYVALSPAAAQWVVERGIKLIGFDYLSVEPFHQTDRATHLTLLGNDVLIVETLDLSAVEPGPYTLVCLPLRLGPVDGAPARVLLVREP
jgi:arylformamidase